MTHANEPGMPPSMHELVDELTTMLSNGDVAGARDRERTWRGDDGTRVDPHTAARWQLARELVDVAPDLPPALLKVLADAVARDDFSDARGLLTKHRRSAFVESARLDALIERRATALHVRIQGCLTFDARADRPVARKRVGGYRGQLLLLAIVLIGVIRLVVWGFPSTSRQRHSAAVGAPVEQTLHRADAVSAALAPLRLPDGHASVAQRQAATALADALNQLACDPIAAASDALDRAPPPADNADAVRATAEIGAIDRAVAELCPDLPRR